VKATCYTFAMLSLTIQLTVYVLCTLVFRVVEYSRMDRGFQLCYVRALLAASLHGFHSLHFRENFKKVKKLILQ
jgi:hypothetical protein